MADAFDSATNGEYPIYVPAVCLVELVYLVEKNRFRSLRANAYSLLSLIQRDRSALFLWIEPLWMPPNLSAATKGS